MYGMATHPSRICEWMAVRYPAYRRYVNSQPCDALARLELRTTRRYRRRRVAAMYAMCHRALSRMCVHPRISAIVFLPFCTSNRQYMAVIPYTMMAHADGEISGYYMRCIVDKSNVVHAMLHRLEANTIVYLKDEID